MQAETVELELQDEHPGEATMLEEVQEGLSRAQKRLPSKYFYDAYGSQLFDQICELPEYYPTRTELAIMRQHVWEMALLIGERALLVELGSGSSLKTVSLLERLRDPLAYVPVDISREHLAAAAQRLSERFPALNVLPVCADFTRPFALPDAGEPADKAVLYFPGSTIGNFDPETAQQLMQQMAGTVGRGGGLLIGVDVKKPVARLEAAYNDARGVTAAFNLNLLTHLNAALGADFDLQGFEHHAFYNEERGRMEMHLRSLRAQRVGLGGQEYAFAEGETIHTENSYKYAPEEFETLASDAGFALERIWMDPDRLFSVQYYSVR